MRVTQSSGLDLNLLVALDVLLEEQSVGGAARRLHLSEPAMSRTLGRIRKALGDPVLVRAGRQMVPTPHALAVRAEVSAVVERARATFTAYRVALSQFRPDPYDGALPRDAEYLSWTLAACAPLPMAERQSLLEADDAAERLILVTDLLRAELRAMNVIPSLPATEVARNRWSPN